MHWKPMGCQHTLGCRHTSASKTWWCGCNMPAGLPPPVVTPRPQGESREGSRTHWEWQQPPPALPTAAPEQQGASRRIRSCPQVFSPVPSSKGSSRAWQICAASVDAFHIKAGQPRVVWGTEAADKLKRLREVQNGLRRVRPCVLSTWKSLDIAAIGLKANPLGI